MREDFPFQAAQSAIVDMLHDYLAEKEHSERLENENASLKAEVERLTALVESNLNSSKVAMGKADAVLHERDSLKAEVERLRKAGDAMEIALQADFNGCPYEPLIIMKAIHRWRAAKEGKQS